MKNFNRKSMLVIACIALVMTITVGGTLAYLIATDGPVTNTFEPRKVTCAVSEDFTDGVNKNNVAITNTGNTDAYIRAAIVGNWYKGGNIVDDWQISDGIFTDLCGSCWKYNDNDGYYYFNAAVPAGKTTVDVAGVNGYLFTKLTPPPVTVDGAHLEVTIVCQAVQAKGTTADDTKAVVDAWGVDPTNLQ